MDNIDDVLPKEDVPSKSVKRRGRPPKTALTEVQKRSVGRPKGTHAIINDYRDRMLTSPKSAKVLEAIFDAALDNENKNQAAAWKLIIDRVAPLSAFDPKGAGSSVPQISINITSLGQAPTIQTVEDITDIEE